MTKIQDDIFLFQFLDNLKMLQNKFENNKYLKSIEESIIVENKI